MATKLYHPTIPDVMVEVEGNDLINRHVEQGWRKSEPEAAKGEAAPAKKAAAPRRRTRKTTKAAPTPAVQDAPKASE